MDDEDGRPGRRDDDSLRAVRGPKMKTLVLTIQLESDANPVDASLLVERAARIMRTAYRNDDPAPFEFEVWSDGARVGACTVQEGKLTP